MVIRDKKTLRKFKAKAKIIMPVVGAFLLLSIMIMGAFVFGIFMTVIGIYYIFDTLFIEKKGGPGFIVAGVFLTIGLGIMIFSKY